MIKRIIEEIKKIKGVRTAFPVDDRIVVDVEEETDTCACCTRHNAIERRVNQCAACVKPIK